MEQSKNVNLDSSFKKMFINAALILSFFLWILENIYFLRINITSDSHLNIKSYLISFLLATLVLFFFRFRLLKKVNFLSFPTLIVFVLFLFFISIWVHGCLIIIAKASYKHINQETFIVLDKRKMLVGKYSTLPEMVLGTGSLCGPNQNCTYKFFPSYALYDKTAIGSQIVTNKYCGFLNICWLDVLYPI